MTGKIYLIPTTLGDSDISSVIPNDVVEIVNQIDYYIVEDERTARRYLKKLKIVKTIDELTFFVLNKHTETKDIPSFLNPAKSGNNIGIISEAGCPGIADPGNDIVRLAHESGIQVVPLVGPSSILMALISSGMNGQNFAFNGYLPFDKTDKSAKIKQLESRSRTEKQSQIFMETPFRNQSILETIVNSCSSSTKLCIATDISLKTEYIKTDTIANWKKKLPEINKRPTIFIIQA